MLVRAVTVFIALAVATSAAAEVRMGPFRLGMTEKEVRAAADDAGLGRVRVDAPEHRDVMGLGLMEVRPLGATSKATAPDGKAVWAVTGYLLSDRLVYLMVDYGTESEKRKTSWFEALDAPTQVRDRVQDLTWIAGGAVVHVDRYGRSIEAVDHGGLKRSNRALVTAEGAVRVADEHFRRLRARAAEDALEHVRQRVVAYYQALTPGEDGEGCVPPPSTDYTPPESACDLPEKRFPARSEAFTQPPWVALGVQPELMSRLHAVMIESSGTGMRTRITLTAVGDIDCDGKVSTFRVELKPDPRAASTRCQLQSGDWEIIDPTE